jgi:hypothetical protein
MATAATMTNSILFAFIPSKQFSSIIYVLLIVA